MATGAVRADQLTSLGISEDEAERMLKYILDLIDACAEIQDNQKVHVIFTVNNKELAGWLTDDPRKAILL